MVDVCIACGTLTCPYCGGGCECEGYICICDYEWEDEDDE